MEAHVNRFPIETLKCKCTLTKTLNDSVKTAGIESAAPCTMTCIQKTYNLCVLQIPKTFLISFDLYTSVVYTYIILCHM